MPIFQESFRLDVYQIIIKTIHIRAWSKNPEGFVKISWVGKKNGFKMVFCQQNWAVAFKQHCEVRGSFISLKPHPIRPK